MPFGRTDEDIRWFKGWYQVVIQPAVEAAGYFAVLAAAEEQPGAINDEIRAHLAFDPMVVVDLGGADPEDDPNPNVMYELGIRHALGLPLVVMAWQGQRLPFDVGNQRVIMEQRGLVDLETNKRKLITFIQNAAQGKYYRPMEAVSRNAALQMAVKDLGPESLTGALVEEIRHLREIVTSFIAAPQFQHRHPKQQPSIKSLLARNTSKLRSEYYRRFLDQGGSEKVWGRFIRRPVDPGMHGWSEQEWRLFMEAEVAAMVSRSSKTTSSDTAIQPDQTTRTSPEQASATQGDALSAEPPKTGPHRLTEELLAEVLHRLPPRPWPTGIHKEIAAILHVSNSMVTKAIDELTQRGQIPRETSAAIDPLSPESVGPLAPESDSDRLRPDG
jgi:hypothetical protein